MEIRKLLCPVCKEKVRMAEATYQQIRRLKIKEVGKQKKETIKIKQNKKHDKRTQNKS